MDIEHSWSGMGTIYDTEFNRILKLPFPTEEIIIKFIQEAEDDMMLYRAKRDAYARLLNISRKKDKG